jgi:predicted DNA-binding transcriptional regulator AlpA
MASNGNFPKPCKLGPPLKNPDGIDSRINFWIKGEIVNWLDARVLERDNAKET